MTIRVTIKYRDLLMILTGAIVLVVAGIIYFDSKDYLRVASAKENTSLQNALMQNIIIMDESSRVDIDAPASAEEHGTIRKNLQDNLDRIEALSKTQNKTTAKQLEEIVRSERSALSSYGSKIDILKKALMYNPQDDIGSLDLVLDRGELLTRVKSTYENLNRISSEYHGISRQKSTGPFTKTIKCLEQLQTYLQSGPDGQIATTRELCIDGYKKTRSSLNEELISTLNRDFDKTQASVKALIDSLHDKTGF